MGSREGVVSVSTYIFYIPMSFNGVLLVLSGEVDIIHIGGLGR